MEILSLLAIDAVMFLTASIAISWQRLKHPHIDGLQLWALSFVLFSLGYASFFLRPFIPLEYAVLVTNGPFFLANYALILGSLRFYGIKTSYHLLACTILIGTLSTLFALAHIDNFINTRIAVTYVIQGIFSALLAGLFFHILPHRRGPAFYLGCLYSLNGIIKVGFISLILIDRGRKNFFSQTDIALYDLSLNTLFIACGLILYFALLAQEKAIK